MFHTTVLRGRGVVRDPEEDHRTATTLELFFDLTFVVAVGRAAAALHHEIAVGHVAGGVLGFVMMFFGIWWAWMTFTWFASAHDSDDVGHRLLTFVQIAGALIFATGVASAVEDRELLVGVVGYVIMRVGLVLSWLRVARDQPEQRPRALRYALLTIGVQVLWVAALATPYDAIPFVFFGLGLVELAIPWVAERHGDRSYFHPEHIEERYGLFTIIVLGESILSAAAGFETAVDAGGLTRELFAVGVGGLVIAFAAWWLYFDHPGHLAPTPRSAFRWGYLHAVVFGGLAALGAGLHVAAEAVSGAAEGEHPIDLRAAAVAVAVPIALFLVGLVVIMLVTGTAVRGWRIYPKLVGAAVIVAVGVTGSVPVTVVASAIVVALLACSMVLTDWRPSEPAVLNP